MLQILILTYLFLCIEGILLIICMRGSMKTVTIVQGDCKKAMLMVMAKKKDKIIHMTIQTVLEEGIRDVFLRVVLQCSPRRFSRHTQ
jgi:hypothetical protein